jgi:GT2 family glycosyltransferase
VRRAALEAVGYFDERLPTGGDVDLGWRLQKNGFTVSDAPEARVAHRHRPRMRQAFTQYRRYGLSTMLLATLHRGSEECPSLALQLRTMASQLRAMTTYVVSFGFRCCVSLFRGFDRRYVLWPVFLFTIESGNLLGKIEGLISTRSCRRNPFPNPRLGRSASA